MRIATSRNRCASAFIWLRARAAIRSMPTKSPATGWHNTVSAVLARMPVRSLRMRVRTGLPLRGCYPRYRVDQLAPGKFFPVIHHQKLAIAPAGVEPAGEDREVFHALGGRRR